MLSSLEVDMHSKVESYILTMDAGTGSARALLVDRQGRVEAEKSKEISHLYPHPGWHEQISPEIWQAQLEVGRSVLKKSDVSPNQVAALGITNQRETTTIWSRKTGEPVYNAINWGDRRVTPIIDWMFEQGWGEEIKHKTGMLPDPTYSAAKIMWLLENIPGVRSRAEKGELAWGTIDTWLLWNLTKGAVHATEAGNASRTMMFNIHELTWDAELLKKFKIPSAILPVIRPTSSIFGKSAAEFFGTSIPITALVGDQQAGLFGQACFRPGMGKKTFGTAGVLDLNAGPAPVPVEGLLSNVGWEISGSVEYTTEGVALMSGASLQWLRDQMGLISNAAESELLASQVPDTGGVYFVPAHQGFNTPYWDMYARGALMGCSLSTTRKHVVRAAIESMVYQTRDMVELINRSGKLAVTELRVDGGGARNEFLCQFLADMLHMRVVRPRHLEATALGAAYLAGLAVRFWSGREEISHNWKVGKYYEPEMAQEQREALYAGWNKAVSKCLGWLKD